MWRRSSPFPSCSSPAGPPTPLVGGLLIAGVRPGRLLRRPITAPAPLGPPTAQALQATRLGAGSAPLAGRALRPGVDRAGARHQRAPRRIRHGPRRGRHRRTEASVDSGPRHRGRLLRPALLRRARRAAGRQRAGRPPRSAARDRLAHRAQRRHPRRRRDGHAPAAVGGPHRDGPARRPRRSGADRPARTRHQPGPGRRDDARRPGDPRPLRARHGPARPANTSAARGVAVTR